MGEESKAGLGDALFLVSEIIVIVLYWLYTEVDMKPGEMHPGAHSIVHHHSTTDVPAYTIGEREKVQGWYGIFQDVHVMIYVGFGFLLAFLKKHSWTSVGLNFITAVWASQITILFAGMWHLLINGDGKTSIIKVDIPALILGDFGAAAVLISFGALLGKCNLTQMWVLATFECCFYTLNEAICLGKLGACDMGGCIVVHTFGAYFGCAACYFFERQRAAEHCKKDDSKAGASYTSALIGMVGTLFLFIYWPSYNAALAMQHQQHRVIVNTMGAITASAIGSIVVCRLNSGRLDMEVIMNATLAGGVSIGSASSLICSPAWSMAIGLGAGVISALGFIKIGPFLTEKIALYDTCGIHNLHGMPGIFGGLCGTIAVMFSEELFTSKGKLDYETMHNAMPNMRPDKDGKGGFTAMQ